MAKNINAIMTPQIASLCNAMCYGYQCTLMSKLENATAGPGQQAQGAGGGGGQGDGEGEDSVGGEHQEY